MAPVLAPGALRVPAWASLVAWVDRAGPGVGQAWAGALVPMPCHYQASASWRSPRRTAGSACPPPV